MMKHPHQAEAGQSAVEIALLLPLLLVIIAGITIVCFIFFAGIQVSNAAREGVRAGSLYRFTKARTELSLSDTIDAATKQALGYLPPANASVSYIYSGVSPCDETNPCAGDQIAVSLTYSYTVPVLSVALPMFQNPVVLKRTVVMVVQ
jgi:Flp pilus assembly protein TadG